MNMENLSALFENGAYTLVVQKGGVTVHKDFGGASAGAAGI